MASADLDTNENSAGTKLKRSLSSMLNQMKMTDEEIEYRMEHFENVDVVKQYLKYIKCTKCGQTFQLVNGKGVELSVHPLLGVLMCNSCCDYYGDGNFSMDSDGEDKYCRWCGEGGTIFACSKCICGFCAKCIRKHFGADGLLKVEEDDDWVCYFCNPKPLWYLRSICFLAEQAWKSKKEKEQKEGKVTRVKEREKERKCEEKEGNSDGDSLSDVDKSKDDDFRIKTKKKSHRRSKTLLNNASSSSEDEKENQLSKVKTRPKTRRKKKRKENQEESTGSDTKTPKKKQKVSNLSDEDSSQKKSENDDDKSFEEKKSTVLDKLKGIWKLTELIMEVGLKFSQGRSKKLLESDRITKFEDLQTECRKLKSFMTVLSRTLGTACKSAANIQKDLTSDNVLDERNVLRIEEIKLKSLGKKLQEDSDIDLILDEDGSEKEEEDEEKKRGKVNGLSVTNGRGKENVADSVNDEATSKSSESSMEEDVAGHSNDEKTASEKLTKEDDSENQKPMLKIKSFARMTDENVFDTSKKVDEGSESVNEGDTEDKTTKASEISSKESEKKSEVDAYDVETETSSDGEENDKKEDLKKKKKERKKKRGDSSGSNFSDEVDEKEKNRIKKKRKKLQDSFQKFRERRQKYLRESAAKEETAEKKEKGDEKETEKSEKKKEKDKEKEEEEEKEEETSKNLNSSDSEVYEKNVSHRLRKKRKNILNSSDEENGKKTEEESSSEEVDAEKNSKKDDSSASDSTPKHSSGETSSDEMSRKKKGKWRRIRKKKQDNSSKSSESEDEDEEEVKKKKKKKKSGEEKEGEEGSPDDSSDEGKTDKKKKGRKNIKKILKKDSLHVETKEALKNEEERKKRLEERQKVFDSIFPEQETDKQLILDFDEETKEPLVTVHKKLVKKLKPHQIKGVKFMWDNCFESVKRLEEDSGNGCILAHCMGLGKTLQVITLVHTLMNHDLGVKTVLIVCPLSTVKNWVNEFEIWLANIHTDPICVYDFVKFKKLEDRKYYLQDWHKNGGVLVLSYDLFRNLTNELKAKGKRTAKCFSEALLDPGPDLVICDEGHLLKNEDTVLSKCMNRIKTSRRIILTGTPLQNNLIEYHCMVQFVKPNILGTKKEFTNRFVNPINNGQFEDSTDLDVKIMKRRAHVLHSMLSSCVQRFDYSVLTPFLPVKYEYVLSIALTETQCKMYRHFIENISARATGSAKAATLFNDFHNVQRVWTHPRTLLMHSKKESMKELEESDEEGSLKDFVVDTDETSSSSSESSSSESEDTPPPPKKNLRSNENNPEEKEEKTTEKNHWWDEFYKESDYEDIRASNKLILLFSLLKHCGKVKDKVLVFSQSLYSLDLIEYFLSKVDDSGGTEKDEFLREYKDSWVLGIDYFRLDGTTSSDTRALWCKHFNKESNSRARLFLISTRAGGLGINLFAANRVVIFDASWNPSHDLQSIFRVYRFGQKKVCYIYRFLAEATMEEKIYERQVTKLSLAHRVVDEHQIERHYSMMDLHELYRFDPTPPEKREVPKLPKDTILADLLTAHKDIIVRVHEHDSLLENREEEELTEEERKAAWREYEEEKIQKTMAPDPMNYQKQANPFGLGMGPGQWNVGGPVLGLLPQGQSINPMYMQPSIPLHILQRGIGMGVTPFFNESCESYFNRIKNRESWMNLGVNPNPEEM